jgi:hypothetical protein
MRVRDKQEMTKHFSDSIKLRTNSLKIRDPPASEPLGASTIRCVLGCSDVRSDGGGGGGGAVVSQMVLVRIGTTGLLESTSTESISWHEQQPSDNRATTERQPSDNRATTERQPSDNRATTTSGGGSLGSIYNHNNKLFARTLNRY